MTAVSSSTEAGWSTATPSCVWLPAQFVQLSLMERSAAGLQRFDQLREDLVDVADDAEVGDREDRSFLVLVDSDDVLRALHPDHVLRGTRDASRDVDRRLHDLAGLTDLIRVRHPSGVDDRTRRARRALQQLGQVL